MAPYRSSELGERVYTKFVRVGERIFVGEHMYVGHESIVEQDGLAANIEGLRNTDPKQLDAGIIDVRSAELNPMNHSTTLDLPVRSVREEARQITRETFAAQSPNHTVVGLERR